MLCLQQVLQRNVQIAAYSVHDAHVVVSVCQYFLPLFLLLIRIRIVLAGLKILQREIEGPLLFAPFQSLMSGFQIALLVVEENQRLLLDPREQHSVDITDHTGKGNVLHLELGRDFRITVLRLILK